MSRGGRRWVCREGFRVTSGLGVDGYVGSLWVQEMGGGVRWVREKRMSSADDRASKHKKYQHV